MVAHYFWPISCGKTFCSEGKTCLMSICYTTASIVRHFYFWQKSEISFSREPCGQCCIVLWPGNILPAKPSQFSWNESSFRSHLPLHIRNHQPLPSGIGGDNDNAGTSFTGNFLWPSPTITPVRVYEFSFFYLSSPDEIIRGDQWLWIFFWPTVHCSYQLDIPGIQFAKPANIGFIRLEFRGWGNMMGIWEGKKGIWLEDIQSTSLWHGEVTHWGIFKVWMKREFDHFNPPVWKPIWVAPQEPRQFLRDVFHGRDIVD